MKKKTENYKKIALMASVIVLFASITGCSLISSYYYKKKNVDTSSKYKKRLEKNYLHAVKTTDRFNIFIKKLNKHYYTKEDFTSKDSFALFSKSLLTDINNAQNSLKEAKTNAVKFSETSIGKKYEGYLRTKNSAIKNLDKVLVEDKKILGIIAPTFNDFQNLITYIDTLKKTQSSNITISSIGASRLNEQQSNQEIYKALMDSQAMALAANGTENNSNLPNDAGPQTTNETPSTQNSTNTETVNQSQTDTPETTTSNFSTEEKPEWVYAILSNEYASKYYLNMLAKQEGSLNSLYTDIFQENQKMNFNTSAEMLKAIESIRTNISDLVDSTKALNDNIIEQRRKNDLLSVFENKQKALELTIENLKNRINNPPSSVSKNSNEVQGYRDQLKDAQDELNRYNSKIKELEEELKKLKTAQNDRLLDNVNQDWWCYGGSLLGIINLNSKIDKKMMTDIKNWQAQKIGKLIKNHYYLIKLAKYQSTKAAMEYQQVSDKLALK